MIIRYDPHLQLRYAGRRAAVVVDGEVQLLQQDAPAAGVVVLGDGVPAARRMRPSGVIVLGADRPDAKILPNELLRRLCVELVEGCFLGGVILIRLFLQREAETPLEDGMRPEAFYLLP